MMFIISKQVNIIHLLQLEMVILLHRCLLWCHDSQHYTIQHNDIQHNDIQHNDIQHNDIQHNDTQNNDSQLNDIQHNKK